MPNYTVQVEYLEGRRRKAVTVVVEATTPMLAAEAAERRAAAEHDCKTSLSDWFAFAVEPTA